MLGSAHVVYSIHAVHILLLFEFIECSKFLQHLILYIRSHKPGGHVVQNHPKHEALGAGHVDVPEVSDMDLPGHPTFGEAGDGDSRDAVDDTKDGENEEEGPPQPKDEEVLLVEQVVAEDTEEVASIDSSSRCSYSEGACHLCGK